MTGKKHPFEHPSENARLVHFRESVHQYDRFCEELLKPEHRSDMPGIAISLDEQIEDDPEVMKLAIKAMLQRKYWSEGEELRLDRVIDALMPFLPEDDSRRMSLERSKTWFLNQYPDSQKGVKAVEHTGKQQDYVGSHELIREMIYGTLMHSDYQKWLNAISAGSLGVIALGTEIDGMESHLHSVRDLLVSLHEEGLFHPDLETIQRDMPSHRSLAPWGSRTQKPSVSNDASIRSSTV